MKPCTRIELLGCPVDALTMDQTVQRLGSLLDERGGHRHSCVSAAKLNRMQRDPALAEAVRTSDVISADGAGVLVAARLMGAALPERVTGIALFLRLVERAAKEGRSLYLLGDIPGVAEAVRDKLEHAFPGLVVVGTHHGYFREDKPVVEEIQAAAPDLLFVAMGTPRQELFQHRWQPVLQVPLAMGVGGSFRVVSNRAQHTPPLIGEYGLEWLHRLAQNPARLLRRNVVEHAGFAARLARSRVAGSLQTNVNAAADAPLRGTQD